MVTQLQLQRAYVLSIVHTHLTVVIEFLALDFAHKVPT